MHPILIDFGFKLGSFSAKLHTYGLMIALGFLIGMQLAAREAKRVDYSEKGNFPQFVLDLCFWILIASMVGARFLFVVVELGPKALTDPYRVIAFWEGGLVFYGGLIGAVLFSIYYSYRHKRSFLLVSDTLIPSVALGQFFGRLGCFAAGCCWGDPVSPDFPLAVQFPKDALAFNGQVSSQLISATADFTTHVHPVQLYESAGALLIFFILLLVRSRKRFHGQVLLFYAFLYAPLRFSLEFIRGDDARGEKLIGPLSTSQFISILVFVSAIALLTTVLSKKRQQEAPAPS